MVRLHHYNQSIYTPSPTVTSPSVWRPVSRLNYVNAVIHLMSVPSYNRSFYFQQLFMPHIDAVMKKP